MGNSSLGWIGTSTSLVRGALARLLRGHARNRSSRGKAISSMSACAVIIGLTERSYSPRAACRWRAHPAMSPWINALPANVASHRNATPLTEAGGLAAADCRQSCAARVELSSSPRTR
ncbi:hypothetical protein D3C73_1443020 [compost metagenome]